MVNGSGIQIKDEKKNVIQYFKEKSNNDNNKTNQFETKQEKVEQEVLTHTPLIQLMKKGEKKLYTNNFHVMIDENIVAVAIVFVTAAVVADIRSGRSRLVIHSTGRF